MWNDKESSVDYLHFEEIAFVAKNILEDESLVLHRLEFSEAGGQVNPLSLN